MAKNRKAYVTLSNILANRWLIRQRIAEGYFPLIANMMNGVSTFEDDSSEEETKEAEAIRFTAHSSAYFISEWGEGSPPENAPANSIAIMGISGVITKYDQWCGGPGMLTKADILTRALKNPNIKGVVLSVDSGGGEGGAMELFADIIRNASKPIVAHVQGMAASAAYGIIAPSDSIVMDGKTSEVGSIGSYVSFMSFKDYWEEKGIKQIEIYAPQSILKNKAFRDALNGDDKAMKEDLQVYTDFFIQSVKDSRPNLSSDPEIFQGKMYYTADAIKSGLADSMGNIDTAIDLALSLSNAEESEVTSNNIQNSYNMKVLLKSAWTGLLSFFGKQAAEGEENVEHEVTQADWEKLNGEIGENATLRTELKNAKDALKAEQDAHATSKQSLSDMTTERDDFKAKWEKGPGAAPTAEDGKDGKHEDTQELSASHKRALEQLD